jgi:hypothetical protein
MVKAKRAHKAETPIQPSFNLMLRASYFYPDQFKNPLRKRKMKINSIAPAFAASLCFVFLFIGCQSTGGTRESPETSIATVDKKVEPVSSFEAHLKVAINDINSSDDHDNLILFIHGRGKHPEKAFKKSLIADLESNYSAKVIMFHWGPSWAGPTGFPDDNAKASAKDLERILIELGEYQRRNSHLVENIKFTLLTHSMGSIVLEPILKSENLSIGKIFDTVVISSSASAGKGHSEWVNHIDFSDSVYVTVNLDDPLLGLAGTKMGGRRLGKGLSNRKGDNFTLANNAKYIDVTEASLGHRYYLHKDLGNKKSFYAKAFFNQVLNGDTAVLNKENGVKEVRRERVYVLKRSQ